MSNLFSPVRLGALELPSRIVMAPMTRSRAMADGTPVPMMATYYRQRAGAGLIVSEMINVSALAFSAPNTPGLFTERQVAEWRKIVEAVHREGGRIFAQISHAGRASHPSLRPDGSTPVAPSAVAANGTLFTPEGMQPYPVPRELTVEGIGVIVEEYAAAVRAAREAGFDGVELHGANGYLIDQSIRDGSNRRSDRYGGSAANRARFLVEVATAAAAAWSADRIGVRLSPWNPYQDMRDSDPDGTYREVARQLRPLGLAYVHMVENRPGAPLTAAIRELFGGPVIGNGGYTRDDAERVLAAGGADAVSFASSYLANPDLPERLRLGAPLNPPDPATFYTGGERGYIDYPGLSAAA